MYASPVVLEEALSALSAGAKVIAGATDVFPARGERPLEGDYVDLSRIDGLRGISEEDGRLLIGAATTWSELARADLPPAFGALQRAAREIGAIQIQNRGTLGGNLCNASPAADGVPPLLILDAEVELASLRGARRLPLKDFLRGARRTARAADEAMTAILCPLPSRRLRSAFLKLGARRYLVISIVMAAVALEVEDGRIAAARVAIGACSATAMRVPAAEARLIGAPSADVLRPEDFEVLTPIDDIRASADYRREAALALTRRAVAACLTGETGGVV